MAMDDTLNLAQAVLVDGRIARPQCYVELVPFGNWIEASVVDCSIYVRHNEGFYFGTVRYQVEGDGCQTRTFHDLLCEGWTTIAFRDAAIAAAKRENRAKVSGCVTPTGRTDGHLTYIKMVKGKTVCAFCLKSWAVPKTKTSQKRKAKGAKA